MTKTKFIIYKQISGSIMLFQCIQCLLQSITCKRKQIYRREKKIEKIIQPTIRYIIDLQKHVFGILYKSYRKKFIKKSNQEKYYRLLKQTFNGKFSHTRVKVTKCGQAKLKKKKKKEACQDFLLYTYLLELLTFLTHNSKYNLI